MNHLMLPALLSTGWWPPDRLYPDFLPPPSVRRVPWHASQTLLCAYCPQTEMKIEINKEVKTTNVNRWMDVFIAISRAKPNTEAHGPKANINLLTWVFDKYLFKWNIYPVKRTASKRTPGHNFQKDEWGSLGKLNAKLICHFPLCSTCSVFTTAASTRRCHRVSIAQSTSGKEHQSPRGPLTQVASHN